MVDRSISVDSLRRPRFGDVFSCRIVGWRTAASMPASLPLDALEMALWTREREGHARDGTLDGLIHHSGAGSQ